MATVYSIDVPVGHTSCTVAVFPQNELHLYVGSCLRKVSNIHDGSHILYVATNVELYWEEHCYVEARFDSIDGHLTVTVNRQPLVETLVV